MHERQGDKKRVLLLIHELRELQNLANAIPGTRASLKRGSPSTPKWDALATSLVQLENELSKITRRYRGQLLFKAERREDRPAIQSSFGWLKGSATLEEGQAIDDLIWLAREGNLDRLGLCLQCGKRWFLRKRKGRIYCSQKCCQVKYEASPKRKKRRRKYQRKYQRAYYWRYLSSPRRETRKSKRT